MEDSTNVGAAKEFGTNGKYQQQYEWVRNLNFGELTSKEVWDVVCHQPQGKHTGAGRLRNMAARMMEYVSIDEITKKVRPVNCNRTKNGATVHTEPEMERHKRTTAVVLVERRTCERLAAKGKHDGDMWLAAYEKNDRKIASTSIS